MMHDIRGALACLVQAIEMAKIKKLAYEVLLL
jgi:hypothetical protein